MLNKYVSYDFLRLEQKVPFSCDVCGHFTMAVGFFTSLT